MAEQTVVSPLRAGSRRWAATAAFMVVAVALGVFSDEGQRLPGAWGQLPELGTPWAVCAFTAAGVWAPRWSTAFAAASGVLVAGLGSYFVFMHLWYGVGYYNLLNDGRGRYWFTTAVVLGVVAAGAATWSRSPSPVRRAIGWGFLPAVPLAEIAFVLVRGFPDPGPLLAMLAVVASTAAVWAWRRCDARPVELVVAVAAWTAAGVAVVPVAARLM